MESAEWFTLMCRDGTEDIWAVELDDVWLESAPSGHGGSDWMIYAAPIPPARLTLLRRDMASRR